MAVYDLATKLNEVAARAEVFVTVLVGTGRFFSAGADISSPRESPSLPADAHRLWLQSFVAFNLNVTHAFAHHPKVLVVGLNGPVVGLSAALVGWADFVYCAPGAWLLTPFSTLGLVAEGGASRALAARLGPAAAAEALLMSRRLEPQRLLQCGFANAVWDDVARGDDAAFRARLLREVDDWLGERLNGESMLRIKKLLRRPDALAHDAQNVREVFAGLDRFVEGVPQAEFRKLASGEKRHKL
ncbi:uncharacterized protein UV8b_06547 [Ustilaginoidea virens]|uniref:3,2-trans-enoyl-CoA isomerase n=1 Tax=Ustilaginoidea virens TaxID=1159556 RepID=A0A8E5MJQ3_USTVR|nr:uncharacterized protein UV8b_06547 [Ustilaginoidea virens]QUC22306.1 hypothetical protein UV8b_06547 [Ustilaginoidea virens]